jgi:hypothetical protein
MNHRGFVLILSLPPPDPDIPKGSPAESCAHRIDEALLITLNAFSQPHLLLLIDKPLAWRLSMRG